MQSRVKFLNFIFVSLFALSSQSLFAAAQIQTDPDPSVSLADTAASFAPGNDIELTSFTIGNYTDGTTISDVILVVKKDSVVVFRQPLDGSAPEIDWPSELSALSIQRAGNEISFLVDLNLIGGAYDPNGDLPGTYRFELKGFEDVGGCQNPPCGGGSTSGGGSSIGNGHSAKATLDFMPNVQAELNEGAQSGQGNRNEGLMALGGGGNQANQGSGQQEVLWDSAETILDPGWGSGSIIIDEDSIEDTFPPFVVGDAIPSTCEEGAGIVTYTEESNDGSWQTTRTSSFACIGGIIQTNWQSPLGSLNAVRARYAQSSFGLNISDELIISGQANQPPVLDGNFSNQLFDIPVGGSNLSVIEILTNANAEAMDPESGDLTASIYLNDGTSDYFQGESIQFYGNSDITFTVIVSDGELQDTASLRVEGNAQPVIVANSVNRPSGTQETLAVVLGPTGGNFGAADQEDGSYSLSQISVVGDTLGVLNPADVITFSPGLVETLRLNVSDSNGFAAQEVEVLLTSDNQAPVLSGDFSDRLYDSLPSGVSISVDEILNGIQATDEGVDISDQIYLNDGSTDYFRGGSIQVLPVTDISFTVIVSDGELQDTASLRVEGNGRPVIIGNNLNRSAGTVESVAVILGPTGADVAAADLEDGAYTLGQLSIVGDTLGALNVGDTITFAPGFIETLRLNVTDSNGYAALEKEIVLTSDNAAPSFTGTPYSHPQINYPETTSVSVDQLLNDVGASANDPELGDLTDQIFLRNGANVYQRSDSFDITGDFNVNFEVVVTDGAIEVTTSLLVVANDRPVVVNPTPGLSYLEGSVKTLSELVADANVSAVDAEDGDLRSQIQFFENDIEVTGNITFDPGTNRSFELRATDSGGNTGIAAQSLTVTSQESLELSVVNMNPQDEAEGLSQNPSLSWDLQENGFSIANIRLEEDPYLLDLDDLQFAIKHKTVPGPDVDPSICAGGSSTMTFSDGLPREKIISDVSLSGEEWVIWCVALVEADGPNLSFLTEFSDPHVFRVRPNAIRAPNLIALPESSPSVPTGNSFITLRASGGEASPSVARFFRVTDDGQFIEIGEDVYDSSLQASLTYEIPDLTQPGTYRFAVSTIRDGIEVGPESSFAFVYYDNDQSLAAPVLENGSDLGVSLIKDVPLDDSLDIEVWRRNGITETCDPGVDECWLDEPTFMKIDSFRRSDISSLSYIQLIADGDEGSAIEFTDEAYLSLDRSHGKGVSYFVRLKGQDTASLRSNSISFEDETPLDYEAGFLSLISNDSGFSADIYIDQVAGYPENSADWIVRIQKAPVDDPSISCSTINFDDLAASEPANFDSLIKVTDSQKGLQSAIKAATVEAIPNQKTCVLVCINDVTNSAPADRYCYDGSVITEDRQPVEFDGLISLSPDDSGTSATATSAALIDQPDEQVDLIERRIYCTTQINDGIPNFDGINPVVIEDPAQTETVVPGLPTGEEIACYMEAIDSGGNITGQENIRFTTLKDNRPKILEAGLRHFKGGAPYQFELSALVSDRNLLSDSNEYVSIVGFSVAPSSTEVDGQSFQATELQGSLLEGNQLENILFSLSGSTGDFNRLTAASADSSMELKVGVDLSALVQPRDLENLTFMIVVEDSSGHRTSYLANQEDGADFDVGVNAGANVVSGLSCRVSERPNDKYSWFILALLLGLLSIGFGRSIQRQRAEL